MALSSAGGRTFGGLRTSGPGRIDFSADCRRSEPDARHQERLMACPLCTSEPWKPQPTSDNICWTTYCASDNAPMIVLNRHTDSPTAGEWHHMERVGRKIFPGSRWRRPKEIPDHFHFHAVQSRSSAGV